MKMLNLNDVKRQLEERLSVLRAKVGEVESDLRTPRSTDWEEQAIEVEGDEVLGALGGALLSEIDEIRKALSRIEKGTYTECELCGNEIGERRLEALPYATKCIKCAQ